MTFTWNQLVKLVYKIYTFTADWSGGWSCCVESSCSVRGRADPLKGFGWKAEQIEKIGSLNKRSQICFQVRVASIHPGCVTHECSAFQCQLQSEAFTCYFLVRFLKQLHAFTFLLFITLAPEVLEDIHCLRWPIVNTQSAAFYKYCVFF